MVTPRATEKGVGLLDLKKPSCVSHTKIRVNEEGKFAPDRYPGGGCRCGPWPRPRSLSRLGKGNHHRALRHIWGRQSLPCRPIQLVLLGVRRGRGGLLRHPRLLPGRR